MDADLRDMGNAKDMANAKDKANFAICEMPWHLLERSFAFLSWHSIAEFSNVCEEWKTTFRSTSFRALRITRQQWFIVFEEDYVNKEMHCWAYDFTIKQWKEIPLSLFPTPNALYLFSDAGQILVRSSPLNSSRFWIWNPITQMVLELPPMDPEDTDDTTVAFADGDNKECFTVLGFGGEKIGIYSFADKRWKTVAYLPRGFTVLKAICSNGFVFMLGKHYPTTMGIMVYDIQDFRFVKSAPPPLSITFFVEGDLLVCESWVLFVGGTVEEDKFNSMSVWELHLNDSEKECWKKIADMPSPMLEEMLILEEQKNWVSCDGVEDYICFRGRGATKIVVFNLTYQCWSYLPERPVVSGFTPDWIIAMTFYTNRERSP